MKHAIDFVSKGIKIFDSDFTKIHSCNGCIQTFNGKATMSFPVKTYSNEPFSIDAGSLTKALEICEWEPDVTLLKKKDKKYLRIRRSTFTSTLRYTTDYIEKKKADGTKIKLPENFIDVVKKLNPFTVQDTQNAWAEAIVIRDGYAYATNNIVIIRTKLPIKDCLIPRELINLMLRVNETVKHLSVTEGSIIAVYKNKAWIECQNIADTPPAIGAVFNDFGKCIPISTDDKKSLISAIMMTTNNEIVIKKGTVSTDTAIIKDTKLKRCCVDSVNLEMLLSMFDKAKFGKQLNKFSGDGYEAILAGRS